MTDARELIGKHVIIQNPNLKDAVWYGWAFAYADFPTIDIEQADGSRISLPASWARLDPEKAEDPR